MGVILLATSLSLVACHPESNDTERITPIMPAIQKLNIGKRRVDIEPLTRRFPLLRKPLAAVWYAGTLGSDRVPGPSTYWIDAIVTLAPETAALIDWKYDPQRTTAAPVVVDALRAGIPDDLRVSASLNEALPAGGDPPFVVTAYYSPSTHKLVITALGQ
jgi:hypothetical protein